MINQHPIENPYDGILAAVCEQLSHNYKLWHEEDKARSPTASDAEIAQVKRAIDKLNQQPSRTSPLARLATSRSRLRW